MVLLKEVENLFKGVVGDFNVFAVEGLKLKLTPMVCFQNVTAKFALILVSKCPRDCQFVQCGLVGCFCQLGK